MTDRIAASPSRSGRTGLDQGRPLLVVAVDGVLADTLSGRAAAFDEAQRTVLGHAVRETSADVVAGVSWAELAHAVVPPDDATLRDLLALAAERAYGRWLATGAPLLTPEAIARARDAAEDGWRVVLRADASRRAASALFDGLAEQTLATRVIAADDVRAPGDASLRTAQYALLGASLGRARVHVVEHVAPGRAFVPALDGVTVGWPTR